MWIFRSKSTSMVSGAFALNFMDGIIQGHDVEDLHRSVSWTNRQAPWESRSYSRILTGSFFRSGCSLSYTRMMPQPPSENLEDRPLKWM